MANKTIIKAFEDKAGVAVGATDLTVSSSLKLPDGTAASPGLHFKDDTNLGLYRIGADQLGLSTAGTFALAIDANQRVGLGTTNPSGDAGSAERDDLVIKNTTHTGISIVANSGDFSGIGFEDTGSNACSIRSAANQMRFTTNSVERMRFSSAGLLDLATGTSTGIQFPNGGTALDWYEEVALSETWTNASGSLAGHATRIGNTVTVVVDDLGTLTATGTNPIFASGVIPANLRPAAQVDIIFRASVNSAAYNHQLLRVTAAGSITLYKDFDANNFVNTDTIQTASAISFSYVID